VWLEKQLKMAPRPCTYAEVLWINEQQFALGLFAGFTYVYQDVLTKVLAKEYIGLGPTS
jgi:hypothetical protein